jgi:RNA polymerase sigma-70 factor (ECF subfamily)
MELRHPSDDPQANDARADVDGPDADRDDLLAFQRSGDRAVLAALWARHVEASYRMARWICGHRAEDALQDAAVQVVRSAARWRDQGAGSATRWLMTVVANAARSQRRRDRRGWLPLAAVGELPAPVAAGPEDERLERVRQGLARLHARDRLPVELRYLAGLDFPAVAAALGVPERTARTRVARALSRLRQRLGVMDAAGHAGVVLLLTPTHLPPVPASAATVVAAVPTATATAAAGATSLAGFAWVWAALATAAIAGGVIWAGPGPAQPVDAAMSATAPATAPPAEAAAATPATPVGAADETSATAALAALGCSYRDVPVFGTSGVDFGPLEPLTTLDAYCVELSMDFAHRPHRRRLRLDGDLAGLRRLVMPRPAYGQYPTFVHQLFDWLALKWSRLPDGTVLLSARHPFADVIDQPVPADPAAGIRAFEVDYDQRGEPDTAHRRELDPDLLRQRMAAMMPVPEVRDPVLLPSLAQYLDSFCACSGGRWFQTRAGIEVELPAAGAMQVDRRRNVSDLRLYYASDLFGDAVAPADRLDFTDVLASQPMTAGTDATAPAIALYQDSRRRAELARADAPQYVGLSAVLVRELGRAYDNMTGDGWTLEARLDPRGHAELDTCLRSARNAFVLPGGVAGWRADALRWRAAATRALQTAAPDWAPGMTLTQRVLALVHPSGLVVALGPVLAASQDPAPTPPAGARTAAEQLTALAGAGLEWSLADGVMYAELRTSPADATGHATATSTAPAHGDF